ncbi:MAG TPA: hypothetical protein VD866_20475 [Urbifossiella sp.]|nr:hypothetical protein [Urbifossiella sp.]
MASLATKDPATVWDLDLVAYLTATAVLVGIVLTRPPAAAADTRWWVLLVCGGSLCYPLAYRPAETTVPAYADLLWWGRVSLHLVADIGLITLGHSFAILPALRGVRTRLMYSIVRHPVYTLYLSADLVFLLLQPSPWNGFVAVIGTASFVIRAELEEQVLVTSPTYQEYVRRVRWKFVPGVY